MIDEIFKLKLPEYTLIRTSNSSKFGDCDKLIQGLLTCLNCRNIKIFKKITEIQQEWIVSG